MNMLLIGTVAIILVVLLGLVGTLWVAREPEDQSYGTVKKRYRNLGFIYLVTIIIAGALLALYLYLHGK